MKANLKTIIGLMILFFIFIFMLLALVCTFEKEAGFCFIFEPFIQLGKSIIGVS